MIYTVRIRVAGKLQSNYVFADHKAADEWMKNEFIELQKEHGPLTTTRENLPGLKVGEYCHVIGDGDEVYKIEKVVKFGANRYGFVLDSGFVEEVAKCYSTNNKRG